MDLMHRASPDAAFLAESALVLFDLLSLVLLCTIFYFVFVGGAVRLGVRRETGSLAKLFGLPALAVGVLAAVNILAGLQFVEFAAWLFGAGVLALAVYYFCFFRVLVTEEPYRVRWTVILWAALAAFTLGCLVFLVYSGDRVSIPKPFTVTYDLMIKVAGVVVSAAGIAFAYVMKASEAQQDQRRKLYQALEVQSIGLFRFEADHPELVEGLWLGRSVPPEGMEKRAYDYLVRQYVCQMLNLFEMAVRFRAQEILPPGAFGSWLIWIWELCQAPRFLELWLDPDDLPSNYTRDFRDLISRALEFARTGDGEPTERRARFFAHVANQMNCDDVETWFEARAEGRLRALLEGAPAG